MTGGLVELPRSDWPPTARLADRLPQTKKKPQDDDILFSCRMVSRIGLVSPKGKLTWSLGNLAPGASRTVQISLQIGSSGGRLTNLAQAAAANARSVRATVRTLVKALPAKALPKVTG